MSNPKRQGLKGKGQLDKLDFSSSELQSGKSDLLRSVEEHRSPLAFLQLFLHSKKQKQLILATVEHLNKATARRFFAALETILRAVIDQELYIPASVLEEETENSPIQPDVSSSEHLQFLHFAALVLQTHLDALVSNHKKAYITQEAFQVAQLLHSVLLSLHEHGGPDALAPQSAILSLCETWWHHQAIHAEQLVSSALHVLVNRALEPEASQVTVKRLFTMRQGFHLLDFADHDSADLKEILMRVASSPVCLKQPLGRRFVAFLLQIPELTETLHQAMKVQITPKKTILDAYGEIYFRAWKEAPEDNGDDLGDNQNGIRANLEATALSELMSAVLHAANPTMASSLRQILQPFHTAKTTTAVESMLYRIYNPILFRALDATNAQVRLQATDVLAQVFPLQDGSPALTEKCLAKACDALENVLQDVDVRVRVAASKAVAQVLSTYWAVIPPAKIRGLLNNIVAKHASDASSATVRAGALNSVVLLLQVPESHAVLRPLLPSLGNLIHDKVERVRTATVKLLLAVKKISGIKYYHVVPVDHLTARLVQDPHNSVSANISALMLNSYFPACVSDQVQRCLRFLTKDPEAASVFYSRVAEHLPAHVVAQLAAMLVKCLSMAVKQENMQKGHNKRRKRASDSAKEVEDGEQDGDDGILSASDTALMASLTETICILWQSIAEDLEEEPEIYQFFVKNVSGCVMTDALSHFEAKAHNDEASREDCHRVCAGILQLAGFLPPSAVEGMMEHITSVLRSELTSGVENSDAAVQPTAHLALLCVWGNTDGVAAALAASIESHFESCHEILFASPVAKSKKRKSGRSDKRVTMDIPHLPPAMALEVVGDILRGADPSSASARQSMLESKPACLVLEQALERGTKHAERLLSGDSLYAQSLREPEVRFILRVCEAFGRFALHKEAALTESVAFSEQASRLLEWTTACVVPALMRGDEHYSAGRLSSVRGSHDPFNDPDLSSIMVEQSFDLSASPISTGPAKRRANRNSTPVRFSGEGNVNIGDVPSSGAVSRAFAVSLLQSSCVIFSEWLAVGGAGANEIDSGAVVWCSVLEANNRREIDEEQVQSTLLPSMCRLAAQLASTCQQFSFLRKLLSSCQESKDEESTKHCIGKLLSSLFSSRGNQVDSLIQRIVFNIIEAAHTQLDRPEVAAHMEHELPTSMNELWSVDDGCVAIALATVVRSKTASIEFAKQLTELLNHRSSEVSEPRALFYMQCLWILCDVSVGKAVKEVTALVKQLESDKLHLPSSMSQLVDELIEGV